jgi:hypothetical protein
MGLATSRSQTAKAASSGALLLFGGIVVEPDEKGSSGT